MKYEDKELVAGTRVTIGRRVQRRKTGDGVVERVSKTYTAEYTDTDGKRRLDGLDTTLKRDARRLAVEIQSRLDSGLDQPRRKRINIPDLLDAYTAFYESKGLAPKTEAKYRSEIAKLRAFCAESEIEMADRFNQAAFHRYGAWLRSRTHKQGRPYASKSLHASLTITKQVFKWAWESRLLAEFPLATAKLPRGKARPQPCFTPAQIEALCERATGETRAAITILAYTGLRVGELEQLRWDDVRFDLGDLGKLCVRRGGSGETTKDKDDRLVPIHPNARAAFDGLPRSDPLVLPALKQRTLLGQVKKLCKELGYDPRLKVHSFRHHFASMVANSQTPYRLALEWMGHSSSHILDMYYHLSDAESETAMLTLADQQARRDR